MTNPIPRRRGAHARTTGQPCTQWAMKNGRCRMHGGKSTGRPIIHGRNTKEAKQARREIREAIRGLREMTDEELFAAAMEADGDELKRIR